MLSTDTIGRQTGGGQRPPGFEILTMGDNNTMQVVANILMNFEKIDGVLEPVYVSLSMTFFHTSWTKPVSVAVRSVNVAAAAKSRRRNDTARYTCQYGAKQQAAFLTRQILPFSLSLPI